MYSFSRKEKDGIFVNFCRKGFWTAILSFIVDIKSTEEI